MSNQNVKTQILEIKIIRFTHPQPWGLETDVLTHAHTQSGIIFIKTELTEPRVTN